MNSPKKVTFDDLYRAYLPLISSMSKKMMEKFSLPLSEYDDLLQEAAVALYTAASAFDDKRGVTFGIYAKVCIKNKLISYIRYRFGENNADADSYLLEAESESLTSAPEQLIISKESLDDLHLSIDNALTPFERSTFWLYMNGMSYYDISKALEKPIKSVDNAIHRVKVKLRKIIKYD